MEETLERIPNKVWRVLNGKRAWAWIQNKYIPSNFTVREKIKALYGFSWYCIYFLISPRAFRSFSLISIWISNMLPRKAKRCSSLSSKGFITISRKSHYGFYNHRETWASSCTARSHFYKGRKEVERITVNKKSMAFYWLSPDKKKLVLSYSCWVLVLTQDVRAPWSPEYLIGDSVHQLLVHFNNFFIHLYTFFWPSLIFFIYILFLSCW